MSSDTKRNWGLVEMRKEKLMMAAIAVCSLSLLIWLAEARAAEGEVWHLDGPHSAATKINRQDFGMNFMAGIVGDDVEIQIDVELVK